MANRIRELRLERAQLFPSAFSVTALAHRVGVTDGMLRRWEKGSSKPSRRHTRALAKELGVSIDELGLHQAAGRQLQPVDEVIASAGGEGHAEGTERDMGRGDGDVATEPADRAAHRHE